MSRDRSFSRLCRLIDDSLHPYAEAKVISLTKDREKDLLIALSALSRKVRLMKQELDCDSDEEEDWESDGDERSSGESEHHMDHNCTVKILADLMDLLSLESQFVQHLVGNILVVVSEFVAESGNEWDPFIHSLFICLKLAIANVFSLSTTPLITEAGDRYCDSTTFVVLRSRLKNANWSTAAEIFRVLRNTLRYLQQEGNDQLLKTYLDSVHSFLLDMPWDVKEEIKVGHDGDTKESDSQNNHFMDIVFVRNIAAKGREFVFLGGFIQFLCSLVDQSLDLEAKVGPQDHHPLLCIIIHFLPTLLRLCLGKRGNCVKVPISQYFRHKLLMLMLRLSCRTSLGYSTLISWLQLMHDYFKDLLWKPISELEFSQDEDLEGSPFLLSLSDGELQGVSSSHLQRWGVLLFLRCCFGLISSTGDTHKQCACATTNSCPTSDSISNLNCYARKKGVLEIYKWLQRHLPTDLSVDSEMFLENCIGFASSFLQLYTHEDDVLFEVLLQLLSIQSSLERESNEEKWTFEDLQKDILSHVLIIFNPVQLFHLFLAELHYDHQVLLDYLISKDTGTNCAEYLLRCLRVVCNSWHLFLTFSMHKKLLKGIPSSLEEKHKKDVECGCKYRKTTRPLFKKAKNCLLSLKYSVENLHRKNLFPYNPEVLLRRLTKFQELCFVHNDGISLTGETTY